MLITINALQLKKNSSGIGVMICELFGRFASYSANKTLFILSRNSPDLIHLPTHAKIVRSPYCYEQGIRRVFFQTFIFGRKYCKNAVLLTTDSKVPLFLPKSCFVISLITDLALYRVAGAYQPSRSFLWRLQYWYLRHRADYFLAVSKYTKQDLMEIFEIPAEKISVVPCAASVSMMPVTDIEVLDALRARYFLPEQYILFVGNQNPRKNLIRIISAFEKAKERGIAHHLVIAGEYGWKFDQAAALEHITHRNEIHFLGFVPDEDMPALYSAASLFLFPTLYEGFGIPVIEAQSCGTPVLTSNCSALPEIGGNAAIYVNPESIDDICAGIMKILTDPALAEKLINAGFENARRFSWDESAQQLAQLIEKVISS